MNLMGVIMVGRLVIFKKSPSFKLILAVTSIAVTLGSLYIMSTKTSANSENEAPLKVAYPRNWGALKPWLQHTMYADAILANQFEPLVDMDKTGLIVPYAAKSWTVSEDFRTFTFEIDDRKFSDGTRLTAKHFKDAWQFGLAQQSRVARQSLGDVTYLLEGFEQFDSTGELSGIRVLSDDRLQLQFAKPFRSALTELTGSRFSAWINSGDRILGSGPYVITETGENSISLSRNPHSTGHAGFERVDITVLSPPDAVEALKAKKIDLFAFAGRTMQSLSCQNLASFDIQCLSGLEGGHIAAALNGLPGKSFSSPSRRRAFASLLMLGTSKHQPFSLRLQPISQTFRIDSQPFLPLQAGRLNDEDAQRLLRVSDDGVNALIEELRAGPPLRLSYAKGSQIGDWLGEYLAGLGIELSKDSGPQDFVKFLTETKKEGKADILVFGGSVADGDPDGLYHILGKTGSIGAPMFFRDGVGALLEEGRQITDKSSIAPHYTKVASKFYEEVPFVHLGYVIENTLYRKDRVRIDPKMMKSRIREPLAELQPAN